MPASTSSRTSSQRLEWREPSALLWASSSTRMTDGRRARAASRSNSLSVVPRYGTWRGGRISSPSRRDSVSARPWLSTTPTTTSTPSALRSRADSSIAKVLPTPAAAPKKSLRRPRDFRVSSSFALARRASGSGRLPVTGIHLNPSRAQCIESRISQGIRLEEDVGERDAERILRARGGLGAEVREAEGVPARLVVAVLEAPDEAPPDLVLDRRGDPVVVDIVPGRGDAVPHRLRVGEVVEPEHSAEGLGPVVAA